MQLALQPLGTKNLTQGSKEFTLLPPSDSLRSCSILYTPPGDPSIPIPEEEDEIWSKNGPEQLCVMLKPRLRVTVVLSAG